MIELLAPAGDFNKLKTAIHFGANAVYVGGSNYGLRKGAKNFNNDGLSQAVEYCHSKGVKLYVTCNIVAHNNDFDGLAEYLEFLESIGVDAVIVSDAGIIGFCKAILKNTEIHLSTQANTTNKYAVKFWADLGVKRVVLARELSVVEIKEIKDFVPSVELEAFVHGAMCVSHSGRCLLSNFLTRRDGNHGDCVQACRWEYTIHEVKNDNKKLILSEDERGSYILNSKDLNMLANLKDLLDAGVCSFKIEGRMKSQYYVGTVVNAYRKGIDSILNGENVPQYLLAELTKTAHRDYTTGFYYGESDSISYDNNQTAGEYEFMAEVIEYDSTKGGIWVEQRNRFGTGDTLEILSNDERFLNKNIKIDVMENTDGEVFEDAKLVQQKLFIKTEYPLSKHDILRKKVVKC